MTTDELGLLEHMIHAMNREPMRLSDRGRDMLLGVIAELRSFRAATTTAASPLGRDRCPLGDVPTEYRCNHCGGLVHFDGMPPSRDAT